MVAFMRGSSPGRNSVIASIRLEASRSSLPNACVKAPACWFQPCSRMAARISSREAAHSWTRSSAPNWVARSIARFSAAQHISLEYRKSRGAPRISQLRDQPLRGPEQLAVHVELALVPGAVADPHRPAVPPASQVPQLPLGEVPLSADPEHDLEVEPALELRGGGVGQELEEPVGLVRAGCH